MGGHTATTAGTALVTKVLMNNGIKNVTANTDSQKELLKVGEKADVDGSLVNNAYKRNEPVKLLDYSEDVAEMEQRMQAEHKGDFCRKCGQKLCRCVDYTQW